MADAPALRIFSYLPNPRVCPDDLDAEFPRAPAHQRRLIAHPAFAPDVAPSLEKLRGAG